ncbi:MAG: T9SS type A sorting domain-containing protein, partial [Prolixibacteraceae bacterium]|nr:T9SS type A sorting domain-containing protein [Prolixibacteraceae bacterium]MBN2774212.1 T9SS type A sorting domain-containing protein [Prolixibacteraceae bacterium]
VSATNVAGTSELSTARGFTTIVALPETPVLAEPANNAINISTDTILKWSSVPDADSYSLQVSTTTDFSALIVDESNLAATTYSISGLEYNTTYYWRINAKNVAGESNYSSEWSFTTATATAVGWGIGSLNESGFQPAYPNPFKNETIIKFRLPENEKILLSIYNIVGQPVRVLVTEILFAGEYTVTWDGSNHYGIPVESGLYICVLKTGNNVFTQKILRK